MMKYTKWRHKLLPYSNNWLAMGDTKISHNINRKIIRNKNTELHVFETVSKVTASMRISDNRNSKKIRCLFDLFNIRVLFL